MKVDPPSSPQASHAAESESSSQTVDAQVDVQSSPEGLNGDFKTTHPHQLNHKRGCKVRQDIYEKLGFKVRKTLQNMAGAKSGLQLCMGK